MNFEELYTRFSQNTKTRYFLDYINRSFGKENIEDKFTIFSADEVIDSLNEYIGTGIKYRITANNYFTYLKKFFNILSSEYNIKNELFLNTESLNDLSNEISIITMHLKESEVKDIATNEEMEELELQVNRITNNIDEDSIFEEVTYTSSGRCKKYKRLVSAIATSLILEYGFKGTDVVGLNLDNYDALADTLVYKSFTLPLKDNLKKTIKVYLIARDLVLDRTKKASEKFLIKATGNGFMGSSNRPDYSSLFCIANDLHSSVAMEKYAYSKIIYFIEQGVDLSTIINLTGMSQDTCLRLLDYYNEEIITNFNPNEYFSLGNDTKQEDSNINYSEIDKTKIRCPSCGRIVNSFASEWVVVTYENNENEYLVCRYCRGLYEKNYI